VKQPKLYLALDTPNLAKAMELARSVNDVKGDFGFKLNLDLLLRHSVTAVNLVREEFGRPVFADTKTWNGGRTMADSAVALAEAGASIVNVYAQAGVKFMQRTVDAVRSSGYEAEVFGLGVLTHYTDADCRRIYRRSLRSAVRFFADEVVAAELDGYIQPGPLLQDTRRKPLKKRLIPAVRPPWYEDTKANAQEQTMAPQEAFGGGADIVVCGSPVFKSKTLAPDESLTRLLGDIG
jgi:orotidine-5'-phosphate decarboxylase